MTVYCGIDPGASGAIAFFELERGRLVVIDMPVMEIMRGGKAKREMAPYELASIIGSEDCSHFVLEKVGAMPGQGVSSMFQFGRSIGIIEGVLAGLGCPVHYVTPQKWQKEVGMRAGKDGARERAMQLFPAYAKLFARKKDDGRADAALIAYWAAAGKYL